MIAAAAATWSVSEDILPLIGFSLALILILMIPVRAGGAFSLAAKVFFASSVASYLVSTIASILNHFDLLPAALDPVITSIEVMMFPLVLFGVYAVYSGQQLNDSIAARHEVVRASEMLESVMDTTPAGVVVLDSAGAITFANPEARRLLDMEDDVEPQTVDPKWSVHVGDVPDDPDRRRNDFRELVNPERMLNLQVSVSWPNGWRRRLVVNTTPLENDLGALTGVVVAFVEREPWSPAVRAATSTPMR